MIVLKKILFTLFLFVLLSCQADKTYVLVEPGNLEIENIYSVSTNKKWTVDNFTLNTVGGDSPKVPNGITYFIGIHFQCSYLFVLI